MQFLEPASVSTFHSMRFPMVARLLWPNKSHYYCPASSQAPAQQSHHISSALHLFANQSSPRGCWLRKYLLGRITLAGTLDSRRRTTVEGWARVLWLIATLTGFNWTFTFRRVDKSITTQNDCTMGCYVYLGTGGDTIRTHPPTDSRDSERGHQTMP